jgi:hypothetical protein
MFPLLSPIFEHEDDCLTAAARCRSFPAMSAITALTALFVPRLRRWPWLISSGHGTKTNRDPVPPVYRRNR